MGGNKNMFDDDIPEFVKPIQIDELHSPFDTEDMWRYKHTRMDVPKENCGCYKTFTKDEHEHYTNWTKTYHYCPKHYTEYLEKYGPPTETDKILG